MFQENYGSLLAVIRIVTTTNTMTTMTTIVIGIKY